MPWEGNLLLKKSPSKSNSLRAVNNSTKGDGETDCWEMKRRHGSGGRYTGAIVCFLTSNPPIYLHHIYDPLVLNCLSPHCYWFFYSYLPLLLLFCLNMKSASEYLIKQYKNKMHHCYYQFRWFQALKMKMNERASTGEDDHQDYWLTSISPAIRHSNTPTVYVYTCIYTNILFPTCQWDLFPSLWSFALCYLLLLYIFYQNYFIAQFVWMTAD